MEELLKANDICAPLERWQVLVEEYSASGKSERGFCRERGIFTDFFFFIMRSL